ncbi:uncharacterized protein DS421_19g653370 [Arachis hypogaea]|uniref:Uncharacterized protein n=1 Tax=Arachis hypogaea TaxID=3818 RepID=A0A6B9V9N9_ARAHY|nr:uncharacterized protein DS421_19g653370 [Arachis hypogaea]
MKEGAAPSPWSPPRQTREWPPSLQRSRAATFTFSRTERGGCAKGDLLPPLLLGILWSKPPLMELESSSAMAAVPPVAEKGHRCCRWKLPLELVSFGVAASCRYRNHYQGCRFMVQSLLICVDVVTAKVSEAVIQAAGNFGLREKVPLMRLDCGFAF